MVIKKAVKKITSKQSQAIPLLASGMSGKNVAIAINCNPATVSQWINHDKQFKEALDEFSESILHLAQVQLESLAVTATEMLRELLTNTKSDQVKLKTIELIFSTVGLGGVGRRLKRELKDKEVLSEIDSADYDFNKLVEVLGGI